MKLIGKLFLGFIAIVGIGLGAVFYFTSGLVEEAERFFAYARSGNGPEAYAMLSQEFKRTTSAQQLEEFLKVSGLNQVEKASWTSRNIRSGQGAIEGAVTTSAGSAIPLKISFVKEEGQWKILGFRKTQAGIQDASSQTGQSPIASSQASLPPEQEQLSLVKEAMRAFGQSINEKSMTTFHEHISNLWKTQYDVAKLEQAYKSVYSIEGDLVKISKLSPVFSKAAILDEQGVMHITGFFPTKPSQVNFQQRFIREGTKWKLLGFNINISN